MKVTELSGHSGCKVLLCETENGVVVRKVSGSAEYNGRLCAQERKQKAWSNGIIRAPKVLDAGYTDDGLFFFDMEYIHGVTLAEYIKTMDVSMVRRLAESLIENAVVIPGEKGCADPALFHKKIDALAEKLSGCDCPILAKGISMLRDHAWGRFVRTPCHGDLTLENIIVKDDRMYLIDFLDSFYDSWIIDIGCLLQDLQTFWAYRRQSEIDNNTTIRLIVFRDILTDKVREIAGEEYLNEVYYALMLKLMRIYPYSADENEKAFLEEKIGVVINMINEVNR